MRSTTSTRTPGSNGGRLRALWRQQWPWSVRILVAVAIIFILQWIPFTGIFLMIILAPFWSVPLINLAVVVAGFEGLTGRAPRWFILVPVFWFGLYTLAYVREERALQNVLHDATLANATAKPIRFDASRYDMVVAPSVSEKLVERLLIAHQVPVVYAEPRRGRDDAMTAWRLITGGVCDQLSDRKAGTRVHIRNLHESLLRGYGIASDEPVCIAVFDDEPTKARFEISDAKLKDHVAGLPVKTETLRAAIDGEHVAIRRGFANPLMPFPMPAMGCFLNSSAPSWDCSADFMRQGRIAFGPKTDKEALAQAVTFSATEHDSFAQSHTRGTLARLATADASLDEQRYDDLRRFLDDPGAFRPYHALFTHFVQQPEKLTPFSDRLMSALEEADLREQQSKRADSRQGFAVARLVAQLPDEEIRRHGPRILKLLSGRQRGWKRYARPLTLRAMVLGEPAISMMIARLDKPHRQGNIPRPVADAMIGLCRVGHPAAAAAKSKLLDYWQWRNRPTTRQKKLPDGQTQEVVEKPSLPREDRYLYLALLRLGLGDEIGAPDPKGNSKWWRDTLSTVTAASPPDVCEKVR